MPYIGRSFFMPFEKGHKGGPGRPLGCKNKSYTNVNAWLEFIYERIEKMDDGQAVQHAFRAAELLMAKIQALPGSPEDSRTNADKALAELKAAEEYGIGRNDGGTTFEPGSNDAHVEPRST
jgi:hypothetical protein